MLLILSQAPWACQVAGYRTWQQLGRQVRTGEKGIAVLAPCRYRPAGTTAATIPSQDPVGWWCGASGSSV